MNETKKSTFSSIYKCFTAAVIAGLFVCILGSCQNLGSDDIQANFDSESDMAKVCFTIEEPENSAKSVYRPVRMDLSEYTGFKLTGSRTLGVGSTEDSILLDSDISYSEFRSRTFTLYTGQWEFELIVYKEIGGTKVPVAEGTCNKTLEKGRTFSIDFELTDITATNGVINLGIKIPPFGASKAVVYIDKTVGGGTAKEVTFDGLTGNSTTNIQDNLAPDYYFIKIVFKDSSDNIISTRLETVQICSAVTTNVNLNYEDINTKYAISYNILGGGTITWASGFTPVEARNASTKVVLPTAADIDEAAMGMQFQGWYTVLGSPVTEIEAGTVGNSVLYGKFTYEIPLLDRGRTSYSGTDSGKVVVTAGTGVTLSELTTPVSSYSTAGNPVSFYKYLKANGTEITSLTGTKSNDPSAIYVYWTAREVYVEPAGGSDVASGFTQASAVKTVAEAKKLLAANGTLTGKRLNVVSVLTDTQDISDLSGLTTAEFGMADAYSYGGNGIINFTSGDVSLDNVTINGGNIGNSAALVQVTGTAVTDKLTLSSGVLIKNGISNTQGQFGGGILVNSGSLEVNGSRIENCQARKGGGIYVAAGNVVLNGAVIHNCRVKTTEYGSGLFVNNGVNVVLNNTKFTYDTNELAGYSIYLKKDNFNTSFGNVTLSGSTYTSGKLMIQPGCKVYLKSDYEGETGKQILLVPEDYTSNPVILAPSGETISQTQCDLFKVADDSFGNQYNIEYTTVSGVTGGYIVAAGDGVNINPTIPTVTEYVAGTVSQTQCKIGDDIILTITPAIVENEYIDIAATSIGSFGITNTVTGSDVTGSLTYNSSDQSARISTTGLPAGIYNVAFSLTLKTGVTGVTITPVTVQIIVTP